MFKQADKRGREVEAVTAGCRAEQRLMGRVLERSQRPPSAESHGNRNAFVYCCCLTVCHAQGQKEYSAMAAQTDYCLLRRVRNFIPRLRSAALLFYDSFPSQSYRHDTQKIHFGLAVRHVVVAYYQNAL